MVLSFISFSFAASSVYILNDILDLDADRISYKRKRPIVAGDISIVVAILSFFVLSLMSLILAYVVDENYLFLLVFYLILTTLYSFYLKQYVVIDCLTLAGLYTARIIGGSLVAEVEASFWLLLFSIFIFLS